MEYVGVYVGGAFLNFLVFKFIGIPPNFTLMEAMSLGGFAAIVILSMINATSKPGAK